MKYYSISIVILALLLSGCGFFSRSSRDVDRNKLIRQALVQQERDYKRSLREFRKDQIRSKKLEAAAQKAQRIKDKAEAKAKAKAEAKAKAKLKKAKSKTKENPKAQPSQDQVDTKNSFIVQDPDRLMRGGVVLTIPFVASSDVSVDQTERFALMMVRGVAEGILGSNSRFDIVRDDNFDRADTLLHGHIHKYQTSGLTNKLLLRSKKLHVVLEAKLVDRRTGEPILLINIDQNVDLKDMTEDQLGYQIGYSIGSQLPQK